MTNSTPFIPETGAVLIEIAGHPAGIALPESGTYRFIAVDPRFHLLDGSRFRKAVQAEIAARHLFAAQGPGLDLPQRTSRAA
jgi:hypothetical protein